MEQYYSIAGSVIRVIGTEKPEIKLFEGFECNNRRNALMTIELVPVSSVSEVYGIHYVHTIQGFPHVMEHKAPNGKPFCLFASEDWSYVKLCGTEGRDGGWMELLVSAFYSRLAAFGGILMHASAVQYRGEALVFTAASGVGKTTQAELWEKYKHAEILNGDKVFLQTKQGEIVAWGSPWCGSSPYRVNKCAPVKAIVVLEQGTENKISRLDTLSVLTGFLPHVFLPSWDENAADQALQSLDRVAEKIPVYRLCCRPDADCVQITHNFIWE